jgi:hypothetical protein
MISNKNLKWLLEPDDPSVRYRTLVELLDKTMDDPEVQQCKEQIKDSLAVKAIFDKMHPDGYWLQKNPRTKEVVGDSVVYGSFATTHFCLSYLAELGLDRNHPLVDKAANRYLNLQKEDGDFWDHFSCLFCYNIRTFIMLGYEDDSRVKKTIDLMLKTKREDGGYLCDWHEGKYKTRETKSCIRGSVKALLAFSYLPHLWKHERCKQLVNYFLKRHGIYKNNNLHEFVNKDMTRFAFPIIWRANIFEILYSLGKMGYGKDKRLESAWKELESRQNSNRRYILDWTPSQAPWKIGKRGEENKWVTFHAYLAFKYK